MPQKKHPSFAALPARARRAVEFLAGFLRLADGLDRTHRQRVRSVEVSVRDATLSVRCRTAGEVELEMWGAGKRLDLLQRSLRLPVRVAIANPRRRPVSRAARRAKARA